MLIQGDLCRYVGNIRVRNLDTTFADPTMMDIAGPVSSNIISEIQGPHVASDIHALSTS